MNRKLISFLIIVLVFSLALSGCGKKKETGTHYEIVDGKIIEITDSASVSDNDVVHSGYDSAPAQPASPGEAEPASTVEITDGAAYVSDEEYNSLASDDVLMTQLQVKLSTACSACQQIYLDAEKGDTVNVTLSGQTIASMLQAVGAAGYPVQDSNGDFNMQCYAELDAFGTSAVYSQDDVTGTYLIVYPDGHLSAFLLSRESGRWHLYSTSAAWNEDGTFRIYSAGRYAVGTVNYTSKGWLIYSRDTSDFDENQKANTDSYVMVRVLPQDSEAKTLCQRYVEPVGYLENNLFTTSWSDPNFAPIDFNSLYAYIFGMYNGTDMLSSYNVRSYYKAVAGSRLYLIPQDIFENNVGVYFRIDPSTLRSISDYSAELGGYFFLGYDRSYYNVTPRTPFPEVVSYTYNGDGSITMVVDAVNKWYGTDRAFRHELTVLPGDGISFRYLSNRLLEAENGMLPEEKLSAMLNVERSKIDY